MPFDVSTMRVGALLDEAARGVHVLATTREARIVTNLGDGAESMVADHDQILRVLTNLLSNALKYSPTGSLVHLSARDLGDAVEVAVEDEGPGIPPEQVDRLFRPFSRLGMQERQTSGGTGLGLAISRAIMGSTAAGSGGSGALPAAAGSCSWCRSPTPRRSAVTAVGDRAVA